MCIYIYTYIYTIWYVYVYIYIYIRVYVYMCTQAMDDSAEGRSKLAAHSSAVPLLLVVWLVVVSSRV